MDDLPELPFDPKSHVPTDEGQREDQYQDLQERYVEMAGNSFVSEIERANGLRARITGEDGEILTDESTMNLIQKTIEDIGEVHRYYSRILKRQRLLSANSKSTKRKIELTREIEIAKSREIDILKTLELLKHMVINRQNKLSADKIQSEYRILQLRLEAGEPKAERSGAVKEKTALKPEKLMKSDPACTLRRFKREFGVYFEASNFQAASQTAQASYLMLLIDRDLITEMEYDPDKKHWIFPEQCAKHGVPEEESIMSILEVAWKRTHPIHTNRCELVNIVQRDGESYAELNQRIDDTFKECEVEGLFTPQAFRGHVIFNALRNKKHKDEILRKTEVKVNITKADCDSVCKIEEHIRYVAEAADRTSVFAGGHLGDPVLPSNSVKRVSDHRTEQRGSGSSSSGFNGRFSHLRGQEKFDAIHDEKGTCKHCLKRHLGVCDLQTNKIKCPKCNRGFHTAEACCWVEGETLKHPSTRRGNAKSRGTKRRFDGSPSKNQKSE